VVKSLLALYFFCFFFNLSSGMIEPGEKGLPQALFAEGHSRNGLIFSFYQLL